MEQSEVHNIWFFRGSAEEQCDTLLGFLLSLSPISHIQPVSCNHFPNKEVLISESPVEESQSKQMHNPCFQED